MKIFLDTANLEEIKMANSTGLLDGVTTNPTMISREKNSFVDQIREISKVIDVPICLEVVSSNIDEMISEAENLIKLTNKAFIKLPANEVGLKAVRILKEKNIQTVVTLCFSPLQALLAAKAGATYVAPFIGRLDDISIDGMEIIKEIKIIYDNYNFPTKIIMASIRSPMQVLKAAMLSISIVTMPYSVFSLLIKHPLTDIGLEKFMADWNSFI